ncbi:MAG: YbaK/EbsC family protein [Anaerolineales bacterium]|nr:YbaK/EbsC family protein [Anaerolineales bacterium]
MPEPTPVSQALTKMGVAHREFRHPGPLRSLKQAAVERGQQPEQIVRSLLFRVSDGEHVMILVAGPEQLSWKRLRRYMGTSRLTMASPEEVFQVTGYPLGAVAPFGLPQPVKIVVDESVRTQSEISLGSGVRDTGIIMQVADLLTALGEDIQFGNFKENS